MSATTGKPSPPASLIWPSVPAGSCPGSWFTATTAPSAASRTAVACPIPVVAPVTSATLPSKRRSMEPPPQKMAIGFHGDPVPPGSRSGSPTTMKSNRPSSSHARATSSSCRLSAASMPMAVTWSGWIG